MKIGIVGLPSVGKSTLFNALTKSYAAPAGNFPFCTRDPNVGIVGTYIICYLYLIRDGFGIFIILVFIPLLCGISYFGSHLVTIILTMHRAIKGQRYGIPCHISL